MATQPLSRAPFKQNWLPLVIALLATALVASLFYTPLLLVVLLGIPFLVYFISRPYELLLLMVFLIPFNFIFAIGPVPVAAELLKVFAWVPFLIDYRTRGISVKRSKYDKYFAILLVMLILSLFRSRDLPFTVKEVVRFGSNLGLCYLAINLVDSREKVLQIFRVLLLSTFLVACYGFYQFAIQDYGALFWIVNPRLDTGLSHYRDTFWEWRNRIISVLTSEMELGHYFNLCIPIGVFLWLTEGRKRISSKWFVVVLSMLAGLLLTFTLGAWLSLASTIAFFVLLFDKKRRWKMVLAGTLVLALVLPLLVFGPLRPFVEGKFLGTGVGSFAWDALTRLDMWVLAFDTWISHPLLGVGVGNYEVMSASHDWVLGAASSGSSPHETYLYLLADLGIVGTGAVLMILLGSIRSNLRLRSNPQLELIGLALAFALTANMIGWFSDDSTFFGPHTSYLVWLLVGLSESVQNLSMTRRHGLSPPA